MMYNATRSGVAAEAYVFRKQKMFVRYSYSILRPETVETLYYLYQITRDPIYREWGWTIWSNINKHTQTKYGYGNLKNVNKNEVLDATESFFFSETMKYLYLLFKDDKVVDLTKQVFNTEAHPLNVFSFFVSSNHTFLEWQKSSSIFLRSLGRKRMQRIISSAARTASKSAIKKYGEDLIRLFP